MFDCLHTVSAEKYQYDCSTLLKRFTNGYTTNVFRLAPVLTEKFPLFLQFEKSLSILNKFLQKFLISWTDSLKLEQNPQILNQSLDEINEKLSATGNDVGGNHFQKIPQKTLPISCFSKSTITYNVTEPHESPVTTLLQVTRTFSAKSLN